DHRRHGRSLFTLWPAVRGRFDRSCRSTTHLVGSATQEELETPSERERRLVVSPNSSQQVSIRAHPVPSRMLPSITPVTRNVHRWRVETKNHSESGKKNCANTEKLRPPKDGRCN